MAAMLLAAIAALAAAKEPLTLIADNATALPAPNSGDVYDFFSAPTAAGDFVGFTGSSGGRNGPGGYYATSLAGPDAGTAATPASAIFAVVTNGDKMPGCPGCPPSGKYINQTGGVALLSDGAAVFWATDTPQKRGGGRLLLSMPTDPVGGAAVFEQAVAIGDKAPGADGLIALIEPDVSGSGTVKGGLHMVFLAKTDAGVEGLYRATRPAAAGRRRLDEGAVLASAQGPVASVCTAPAVKYYALDTPNNECAETCLSTKIQIAEFVGLLYFDGKPAGNESSPCADHNFQSFNYTDVYGVGPLKVSMDHYVPDAPGGGMDWKLTKLLDNTTAMPKPDGESQFVRLAENGAPISTAGDRAVFFGENGKEMTDPSARSGVYQWDEATGVSAVADDNHTAVPGQAGYHFSAFGHATIASNTQGDTVVCFMGEADNPPAMPVIVGIWCRKQMKGQAPEALTFIVGSSTVIPDSPEPTSPHNLYQYVDYPAVSLDAQGVSYMVVFQGNDGLGRRGVYRALAPEQIETVTDWQDPIMKQSVFNIQLNVPAYGGGSVALWLAFNNGNEGIFATTA